MQHLHLRQQCGGLEILEAHRLEAANEIAAEANPAGYQPRGGTRLPVLNDPVDVEYDHAGCLLPDWILF